MKCTALQYAASEGLPLPQLVGQPNRPAFNASVLRAARGRVWKPVATEMNDSAMQSSERAASTLRELLLPVIAKNQ